MFSEPAIRRVENYIFFMDSAGCRTDGFGAQAFQNALEGFEVADFEFNFRFVRHGYSVTERNWRVRWCQLSENKSSSIWFEAAQRQPPLCRQQLSYWWAAKVAD